MVNAPADAMFSSRVAKHDSPYRPWAATVWAPRTRPQAVAVKIASESNIVVRLGNFVSKDSDICLRIICGSFAENCGDSRRLSFSTVKWPTSIAEICGDEESAPKVSRKITRSWLVKFPRCGTGAPCCTARTASASPLAPRRRTISSSEPSARRSPDPRCLRGWQTGGHAGIH